MNKFRQGMDTRSEDYSASLASQNLPHRAWVDDGPALYEAFSCACGGRFRNKETKACRKCGRT